VSAGGGRGGPPEPRRPLLRGVVQHEPELSESAGPVAGGDPAGPHVPLRAGHRRAQGRLPPAAAQVHDTLTWLVEAQNNAVATYRYAACSRQEIPF